VPKGHPKELSEVETNLVKSINLRPSVFGAICVSCNPMTIASNSDPSIADFAASKLALNSASPGLDGNDGNVRIIDLPSRSGFMTISPMPFRMIGLATSISTSSSAVYNSLFE